MLFSSSIFLFNFLPITLFIYYVFLRNTKQLKNYFLLIMSLIFYAWGEPKFVIMLIFSIIINWFWGLLIDKKRNNKKICKLLIVLTLMSNLSVLLVFKYLGFLVTNLNSIFSFNLTVPQIALPIGISFFTFQAISYVIDVYRENGKVQKNILNVGLYLAFFPQLIAGPIVRYETIAEQINNRKENFEDFSKGTYRFLIGLFKKVLISNQMALVANIAFDGNPTSVLLAWLCAIAYALQIYFDFSGYSDMAIGLGNMFGFKFEENFDYPYTSKSITEFWRRWHISLGTWFRDYVYIPLGGSRCKKSRAFFNIFIVWLLTGVWHGASWNFILWGLYFFVFLILEKSILKNNLKNLDSLASWKKLLLHLYTLIVVLIGWVLFRTTTLTGCFAYLKAMFGLNSLPLIDVNFTRHLSEKLVYLIAGIIFSIPTYKYLSGFIDRHKKISYIVSPALMTFLFLITISFLVKGTYNPFIYFNF